jgi:hypothetical protein
MGDFLKNQCFIIFLQQLAVVEEKTKNVLVDFSAKIFQKFITSVPGGKTLKPIIECICRSLANWSLLLGILGDYILF